MPLKRYSTVTKSLELEPHHQMPFSVEPRTLFISLIDGTRTWTTTLGYSGPGSNANEEVQSIPKSSRFGDLPSDAV